MKRSTISERALVLAPRGRDAVIAAGLLHEAGFAAEICAFPSDLITELNAGAAFVVATEEALTSSSLEQLTTWLNDQQEWSDLPFVLLTTGGGGLERNPAARRYLELLGNVTFLERPFHPTTLVSLARSALRSRRRQYEARARLDALRESEARRAAALEIAQLGSFEWDLISDDVKLDRRSAEIFALSPEGNLTSSAVFRRIHPDDLATTVAAIKASERDLSPLEIEYRIILPNGAIRTIASLSHPTTGASGKPERMLGVFSDVTERKAAEEAGAVERKRQQLMLKQMPGFAALLSGPEHRFEYANDAYVALLGSREHLGRTVREVLPELEGQGFYELLDTVHAGGEPFAARAMPVRLGPGQLDEHFLDFLYQPVRSDDGTVTGIFVGGYDVTEQVRAQRALADSESRYRALFENIDEGFCIIEFLDGPEGPSSDYVHVEANPAYTIHAGIPDVVGRRVREMVPDEADGWIAWYRRVLMTGEPIRFERELVATGRHLELAAFRVEPAARRQVAVVFRDITARKQAETALRELNETLERRVAEALAERKVFADIVEGTDAIVQVVDLELRWMAINRSAAAEFERVHGVRPIVGNTIPETLAHMPESAEGLKLRWARAISGESFTLIEQSHANGREGRYFETKYSALRDTSGRPIGAYQFAYDVTERVREQERLVEAEEQLRQSQKMDAMGQLTGGVAHDFNNLLTPIVGALDLLQRKGHGGEREQRLIAGAMQSAERAKTLVQRLLAFARRQPLQATAVSISELVAGMADLISSTSGPQIKVIVETPAGLLPAKADPNQLEMALLNLCVNARDAMPSGGTLRISASEETVGAGHRSKLRSGRYVRLSVADTGVGMDEQTLEHAIEPFFSTKGVGKGTGLGLSMVHGLASQLGGALAIQSRPGAGTTIELWLPVSEAPPETAGPVAAVRGSLKASRTVLLVEDEALIRLSTADMLNDMGFKVVEAGSAEEALHLIERGLHPHLLISDHLMPGMNGTELAKIVRTREPGVQVLIVSGYAESHGLAPEIPRLNKPFRNEELAAMLSRLS